MIWQEIVTVDAKPTAKALDHIRARLAKGECIGCKANPGKAKRRGLCDPCYEAWRSARIRLATPRLQAAFDARLIRMGRLLMAQGVRVFNGVRSVFQELAEEVKS